MKANVPKGYGGGPSNMQSMLRQAQKMQEKMQEVQAELEEKEYEIKAGGGAVTLKINGKKEIVSLDISPDLVDPDDIDTLSDVLVAAFNEGIRTVEDASSEAMGSLTGNMSIPGLF